MNADDFASANHVSRETMERLRAYVGLLEQWNKSINLVGAKTLRDPWMRHVHDSYQIVPMVPETCRQLADLGSGGGVPGLIIAASTSVDVHLIESDKRKAAFLRQAAITMQLKHVTIHAERLENVNLKPEVITARAFAPLPELLNKAGHMATPATLFILLKGRQWQSELTEARSRWKIFASTQPSVSHEDGQILTLTGVTKRYV